ncbi:hypothetical protein PP713_14210 [Mycobacterium sp. CSUR Q5927]|nr:hypothetical protein [Mycobacterium sp. CSUR Q5927]
MSIADALQGMARVNNRILILDVERIDGITQQHWWDRGDLQKRYIHHETVIREPRTTIVCAKWHDSDEILTFAEWDKGGRKRFLRNVHALMSSADIIVAHNGSKADIPWLLGDFRFPRIGCKAAFEALPDLPPYKLIDTLTHFRSRYKSGLPFKGLDAALQILGHPGKTDRYDPEAMERAVAGSVEDRERLIAYCQGDVIGGQWIYDRERPMMKNHPALFVDGEDKLTVCNRCGHEMKPIARRYIANVMSYSMRRCVSCRSHSIITIAPERLSMVRGV